MKFNEIIINETKERERGESLIRFASFSNSLGKELRQKILGGGGWD